MHYFSAQIVRIKNETNVVYLGNDFKLQKYFSVIQGIFLKYRNFTFRGFQNFEREKFAR